MVFTVAIGSGVAIIACGNTAATPPYSRGGILLFPHHQRTRRNNINVACAKKPVDEEISVYTNKLLDGDVSVFEKELLDDDDAVLKFIEKIDLELEQPDFWEGDQWNWFGTFVKYSWILGVAVAASLAIYGCFTFREPSKELREASERLYSVQSGVESSAKSESKSGEEPSEEPSAESSLESPKVFEEPDAYDSDVFDSNPTEVAPSLE